ncbi:MAG: hypothetical protein H0W01_15255 [Pseudonocardiales bacterium]|nr:hypothetical protein [Pseudonocardiales bacterium]
MNTTTELTARHRALLRAVAAGRCELNGGRDPDLLVDGLCCCDQFSARQLLRAQLVTARIDDAADGPVPATLTAAGQSAIEAA